MTHRGHSHTTLVYGFTRDRGNNSANARRMLFRCWYRVTNQLLARFHRKSSITPDYHKVTTQLQAT